jgi:2-hydroxymuconate-semialdehyde hydrolase
LNVRTLAKVLALTAAGVTAFALAPYLIPGRQRPRLLHQDLASPDDHFVTVDGFRMRYQVKGEGTPLILIHGFASSIVTWHRNIDDLARDHRVYAIDLKGWGLSDKPSDGDYSLLAQAHHLRTFMLEMGIERAVLVGHSMGGTVCAHFAIEYPAAVLGIVLIDPAGARRFPYLWLLSRALDVPVLRRWMRLGMQYAMSNESLISSGMPRAYYNPAFLTPEMKASLLAPFHTEGFDDAFIKFSRDMRHIKLHGRTHRVQCPTLIVWGEHDLVVPPVDGRYFVEQIQNSRLVILPNAGHLPHDEQADTVNALIREFTAGSTRPASLAGALPAGL